MAAAGLRSLDGATEWVDERAQRREDRLRSWWVLGKSAVLAAVATGLLVWLPV